MNQELEMILRLVLAGVLGACIGYQRERAKKPAGLRTHILISMGASLFTVVSIFGFKDGADTSRIAAGVVTGVGFLGAGVIFRSLKGDVIVGLTTAASVWMAAAIGLTTGTGLYLLAIIATVVGVLVLIIPTAKG